MKLADYPPQEPLSEAGQAYSAECWRRSEGIPYQEVAFGPNPYQRLAIFEAKQPAGLVLLFWHGGGWTSGYKEWMGFMAPALNAAGITFVSGGYRLAPEHVFPAGLDDCLAAVKWVSQNLKGHLFIGGHSAGGHYAALIAARAGGKLRARLPAAVGRVRVRRGLRPERAAALPRRRPRPTTGSPARASSWRRRCRRSWWRTAATTSRTSSRRRNASWQAVRAAGGEAEELELAGRTHFTASYAGGEADGPWVPAAVAFMRAQSFGGTNM